MPRNSELEPHFEVNLLGGIAVIKGDALVADDSDWDDTLYRAESAKLKPFNITAVPYCVWDHREAGEMRVWIRSC